MTSFAIRWTNGDSKNYVDILPLTFFRTEAEDSDLKHKIRRPNGTTYAVRCKVNVKKNVATLTYDKSNNRPNLVWFGVTRITFATSERKQIRLVEWRDEDDKKFVNSAANWSVEHDLSTQGKQPSDAISETEERIRAIVPERQLLDALQILAELIRSADKFAPTKWGIRVSRKNVMLKVGFVEVLQFHNNLFHQIVKRDLVPNDVRRKWRTSFGAAPYKNAPECDSFDSELSMSKRAYGVLLAAHKAAIQIAARSPIHTSTKADHSPELVDFISRMVKIQLPQPGYVRDSNEALRYPDEVFDARTFVEGAAISVMVNRYERDRAARKKCIQHHGASCFACDISFGDYYGPRMSGFIHVHHLIPLSGNDKSREVDPIRDLRPVCPNCHAVIHSAIPPLTVDQVRSLMKKADKTA